MIDKLKEATALLKEVKKLLGITNLNTDIHSDDSVTVHCHRASSHKQALAMMRLFGVSDMSKSAHDAHNPWHCMVGKNGNIEIKLYVRGLPPSCKIVRETKTVPKMVETGELVTIETTKIVCGE